MFANGTCNFESPVGNFPKSIIPAHLGLRIAPKDPLPRNPLPRYPPVAPRPRGGRFVEEMPGLFVLFGITWGEKKPKKKTPEDGSLKRLF